MKRRGRLTAVEELELRSRILAEISEGANLVRIDDGIIVYTNARFDRMFGYVPGELLGRHVTILNDPAAGDPEERSRMIEAEIRRSGRWEGEIPNRCKDGSRIWCRVSVTVIEHPRYGRVGISIHRDITQDKRANAVLASRMREKDLFTEALLSAIPTPVFFKDKEGRYLGCNSAFTEIMGVSSEAVRGKTVYELWPGEHARMYHKKDLELMRRPARQLYEFKVRDKDGRDRPVLYAKDVFRDENGAVAGIVGAFMDITERKRLEEDRQRLLEAEQAARAAAEEANRAKDEFLAIVSHELRTPLTGMMGWLWLLRRRSLDAEEARGALDSIEHSMHAQMKIVSELLDVTHLLSGKMPLERQALDVAEVLRAAADAARPAAAARRVRLALPAVLPAARVLGDSGRLRQVFGNLLDNAIRFSKPGRSVRVGLSARGAAVCVTVADSGAGIAPDFLRRMFSPFLQAEDSLTREHGGLGVGLVIARRLAELHGGSISAFSRGPGRGSRFTVELPAAPPAAR